jgi:ketosteroid isomerase-like protein
MITSEELAIRAELRGLAERYAQACDRGDGEQYAGVFLPDGWCHVSWTRAGTETSVGQRGHDELAKVPQLLRAYTETFHFLGQSTYEIGDGEATGEVYCLAHHLTTERHGGTSYVMHIRYHDLYRPDADGRWKIADRHVNIDWTDTRAANPTGR